MPGAERRPAAGVASISSLICRARSSPASSCGKCPAVGDALMLPPGTVHSVRNVGRGGASLLATYVVENGKPSLVVVD